MSERQKVFDIVVLTLGSNLNAAGPSNQFDNFFWIYYHSDTYFDRTLLKFVVNMMKGEQDKDSIEQPEILALPAPSLTEEQKSPPVQNGTPTIPVEDGM